MTSKLTFVIQSPEDKIDKDYYIVPRFFLSPVMLNKLTASQFKVLAYFVSFTYGWKKNNLSVGLAQIASECGLSYATAQSAVSFLLEKKFLAVTRPANRKAKITREYGLVSGILTLTVLDGETA